MTLLKKIAAFILILNSGIGYAQIGGKGSYYFLNLPQSARASALGGNIAPLYDRDVNVAFQNPSCLNDSTDKQLGVNYLPYFAGVNAGYFSYGKKIDKHQHMAFGLLYYNYGRFDRTDAMGNELGSFGASDYVAHFSYGRHLHKRWYGGANFKMFFSQYEKFNSLALGVDVAASYIDTANKFVTAFILKNAGFPVKNYIKGDYAPLPIEFEISSSIKLKHAPIRFIVTANNLQRFDLSYTVDDPRFKKTDLQTGEFIENKVGFGNKLLRHFIFATELVFSKNFNLRAGYNFRRRQEMKMLDPAPPGFTGFSWGFSIGHKKSDTNIAYSNAGFFKKKGTHQISLLFDIKDLRKKKNL